MPQRIGERFRAFTDEHPLDPVSGVASRRSLLSVLSKSGRLSRWELDEIFLSEEMVEVPR